MDILITGSSGFVGKNLLSYLIGKDLSCTVISRESLQDPKLEKFNEKEAIIHLAGKAHDLKSVSDPQEYYKVNYELTKELYNSFIESDIKKFIFISSVKAIADQVPEILTEDADPNPQTHYGKSKLMAEKYIQSMPLPEGKSFYVLRPCMIHGPGNKGNLNLLYNFVKRGIPYPLAGFRNKRSFLSVQNLCFIINELIIRNDIPSGVYQVADDESLSTNDVVTILAASLNTKPRLWKISPRLVKFIAKIGDIIPFPLSSERLNKLTESYVVSNKKIRSVIGKKLPLTATEGLKFTAISFNEFD